MNEAQTTQPIFPTLGDTFIENKKTFFIQEEFLRNVHFCLILGLFFDGQKQTTASKCDHTTCPLHPPLPALISHQLTTSHLLKAHHNYCSQYLFLCKITSHRPMSVLREGLCEVVFVVGLGQSSILQSAMISADKNH